MKGIAMTRIQRLFAEPGQGIAGFHESFEYLLGTLETKARQLEIR
jgi:hypothetical protein